MTLLLKVLLTIAGGIWSTVYLQQKLGHLPVEKQRLPARIAVLAIASMLGLYFALDNKRYTYNSEEFSEVSTGYPFRISSNVRYYDGVSEDSVSPYPNCIRGLNFLVGFAIIHFIGAIVVYTMDLPEPGKPSPGKKAPKPDAAKPRKEKQ